MLKYSLHTTVKRAYGLLLKYDICQFVTVAEQMSDNSEGKKTHLLWLMDQSFELWLETVEDIK